MEVNLGSGESVQLLNDRPFFKMMQEAKKRLQAKLIEAEIPEKSQNVVRICIDHITILLQQSRLHFVFKDSKNCIDIKETSKHLDI